MAAKKTAEKEIGTVTIENARLAFRNFNGEETRYNRKGNRAFAVLLDNPDVVKAMEEDGWNIKYLKPREDVEGDEPQPYVQVTVRFEPRPPKIVMITNRKKTFLGEETVGVLDYADIKEVDLILSPFQWEVNGNTGVKAYLKTMYVTLVDDELENKYWGEDD